VAIVLSGFGAALLALMIVVGFAICLDVYAHVLVLDPRSIPLCVFLFLWSLAACWTSMQK
jgi:hypothetical protein